MRNSILRTVSVMYTLNREMDNVYVTDSYWQKQQQTLVVKRRAGMMDSYLCFNLYTSKCQCAKNNKSKERTTGIIITDNSSTVSVFLRICCGLGNDKFYYRLKYIKNLVPASSQVGDFPFMFEIQKVWILIIIRDVAWFSSFYRFLVNEYSVNYN